MGPEGLWLLQGVHLRPDTGDRQCLLCDPLNMSNSETPVPATFFQFQPDWVRNRLVLWAFPLSLALTGLLVPPWRQTLWPTAFFLAGGLCLGNALRCGRVH